MALIAAPARAADPLNTIRAFCQADGRGMRVHPREWAAIAPLVWWVLEPAWDHLSLIRGFELGTPVFREGAVEVAVQYTVTADIRSGGISRNERVETRTFRMERDLDGMWRIRAPAPPPYVFESEADPEALAALLDPEDSSYVSDSAFAWRMLRSAGWFMPYADLADLASSSDFAAARTAAVGDLAIYYDGDQPYHVGVVESDGTVVSATLNGGIQRSLFSAFAGEIRYRRPVPPKITATVEAVPTPTPKRPAKHRRR